MATVKIPTPLRLHTEKQAVVTVNGGTVAEVMDNFVRQYPGVRERLYKDKVLRRSASLFIGKNDIRSLDGLETILKDGDTLRIILPIAGG